MTDSIDFQADKYYEAYEDGKAVVIEDNFFSADVVNKRGLNTRHAQYVDSIMDSLVGLQGDFEQAVGALEEQIANCDDPIKKQELEGQLDNLKEAWTNITHHPPGHDHDLGKFKAFWQDRIANMRTAVMDAHTAAQSASSPEIGMTEAQIAPPRMQAVTPAKADDASRTSTSSTTGASSSTSSGGADAEEALSIDDVNIAEMINQMSTDPQGVMDQLQNMDVKDRGLVMQMINTQLQQLNQMFSMMSNMMKSMHDTAKAAINNMRV